MSFKLNYLYLLYIYIYIIRECPDQLTLISTNLMGQPLFLLHLVAKLV